MLGRLITVETYLNAMEARLVQQQLEAAGIRCVLADEYAVSALWHLSNAMGGIKLQVAEEDFDRASAILDELEQRHLDRTAKSAAADDEAARNEETPPVEPKPGHEDDEEDEPPLNAREDNVERAYRAVLVGCMIIPLQLYATWVLLDVWKSDLPLRPALRRKLKWTLVLHLPMLIVAVIFVALVARGMRPSMLDLGIP